MKRQQISLIQPKPATNGGITIPQGYDISKYFTLGSGDTITISPGTITISLT